MDMREFVEGLTSEQRERFKACASVDDIAAFAKAEKLSVPDDLLEKVAGGVAGEHLDPQEFEGIKTECPWCGNKNPDKISYYGRGQFSCEVCNATFGPRY